ncbi:protein-L-isoaspartate(D-aspartate) O-methyltransferase [Kitasatospora sp. MAP12-15]|uniref:methyltransferase domain-containing protein n=1 Tax=unclassified Kitasatospora TaxID=2633591 RepID=UPI0024757471|nr:methyltransferase domain-containing protein [Kitasatospora sp. MAP12-44]MDH6110043.1 protein-L-isoaspartate(D-aspartate) O-methyltransferase [Kitasatospora sp. MAP12-44]
MTWTELTAALLDSGALPAKWEKTFTTVPRTAFTPDRIHHEGKWIDRRTDSARWMELVCSDLPLVTQLYDDGQTPSSSSSMPTVVATMLRHLEVTEGMRVLEIGTGTGWTAALLARHLGGARVTSVEVDAGLADLARTRLGGAHLGATVVAGDGALGYRDRAPYDRVHATAAVRRVPFAWVEQTRPGGLVLTPFGTAFCNGALLKLTVADDGRSASGPFVADVAFMWVRDQRPQSGPFDIEAVRHRASLIDPAAVEEETAAAFAVGLLVPGLLRQSVWAGYDRLGTGRSEVWDGVSYAHCRLADWNGSHAVAQSGPRNLWTEVEEAYAWWDAAGRPGLERFGLTVTPDGQTPWLDEPAHSLPSFGRPAA